MKLSSGSLQERIKKQKHRVDQSGYATSEIRFFTLPSTDTWNCVKVDMYNMSSSVSGIMGEALAVKA